MRYDFQQEGQEASDKKVVIKQQSPLPVDWRQVRGGLAGKPSALEFLEEKRRHERVCEEPAMDDWLKAMADQIVPSVIHPNFHIDTQRTAHKMFQTFLVVYVCVEKREWLSLLHRRK